MFENLKTVLSGYSLQKIALTNCESEELLFDFLCFYFEILMERKMLKKFIEL